VHIVQGGTKQNSPYILAAMSNFVFKFVHCVSKKWGTHIVPHSSHKKNQALIIKFGTVNCK